MYMYNINIYIYICVYILRERDSHTCVDMSMNRIDNLRTKNGRQSLGGIQHWSITARQWIFKSEGWVNHMTKTMALVEEMIKTYIYVYIYRDQPENVHHG